MPAHEPDDRDRTAVGGSDAPAAVSHASTDLGGTLPRGGDDPPAMLGLLVPGFAVSGEIARGGMGAVLAATELALGREVAIKTLLPGTADPAAARRFVQEARITAGLAHPGIPPIHQTGALPDGRPFLAMKLIRGKTLAALLSADDKPDLLHVFEQVCQAVGFAHSKGIIHRDLKPLNVMVGAFGEVQVMDWGLARALTDPHEIEAEPGAATVPLSDSRYATQAGHAMGTPQYMPPEQARGDWDLVTARADVFALGGILAAVLTGHPPHDGPTTHAVLRSARTGDMRACFARLDACAADPELINLAKQCLAPDPIERPEDAAAVAKLVAEHRAGVKDRLAAAETARAAAAAKAEESALRAEEAHRRAEAEAARAREQTRRRRTQLLLAAALALLVAGGAAFAWHSSSQAEKRRFEAARQEDETRTRAERNGDALERLLSACESAIRADDTPAAEAALAEAERRRGDDGAAEFSPRLDRCRTDLTRLTELDRIDETRWTEIDNEYPTDAENATAWAAFFARHGVRPEQRDRAAVARLFDGALTRERMLAALDGWLAAAPSPVLLELVQELDPDPYRDAVRIAVALGDPFLVRLLAVHPALDGQPLRTQVFVAVLDDVPPDLAEPLLDRAHRRAPRDVGVLMAMGTVVDQSARGSALKRAGWYRTALAVRPNNATLWNNLGWALRDAGDDRAAAACFREAIRINPKYSDSHHGLGLVLLDLKEYPAAIASSLKAIELLPRYANPHNALGCSYRETGRLEEAAASFRRSIELDPEFDKPRFNLAYTYEDLDRPDDAIAAYHGWLGLKSKRYGYLQEVGGSLDALGDYPGALRAFREMMRRGPRDEDGFNSAAWLLATCPDPTLRNGREAVTLAKRACDLGKWRIASHIDTLAAAHAESGNFAKAVEYAERSLQFPDFERESGDAVRERIALFRQKKPYHEPWPVMIAPPPRPAGAPDTKTLKSP